MTFKVDYDFQIKNKKISIEVFNIRKEYWKRKCCLFYKQSLRFTKFWIWHSTLNPYIYTWDNMGTPGVKHAICIVGMGLKNYSRRLKQETVFPVNA